MVPAVFKLPLKSNTKASLLDPKIPFPITKAVLSVSKTVALPPLETEDPTLL